MVSQADRELISNFVAELRPYLETVAAGVQEFAQPNRDGVVVGQAVQALVMIRGAGQILMVDGLVSIASWLTEAFELVQSNPDLSPAEAARRLGGLSSAMEDYLRALDRGEDVDPIVLRARTIFEAIPAFSGPLPGTGRFRSRTDLDALFGDDESTAPTDRITPPEAIDTERLRPEPVTFDAYGQTPDAMPTVPLQHLPPAQPEAQPATPPEALPTVPLGQQGQGAQGVADGPARIVPIPPQPTEKLPEVDPELREIFEDEALEIIGTFGDNIRILAGKPDDFEAISRLNRAAHTLKGAANMTGFPVVGQIGAAIERLMDEHIERHKPITRDALELVAVSWKMLRAMMPHLNDLSSFTSPSNSVVQRANVLRERLASEDAEAETLSIGSQRIARPPAGEERAPEAPEPQDEIVAVSARPTDEDTAQIKADEVTPEPAAVAQDVVIDVEVADSEHVAEPETLAEPEHFAEPEAPAEVEETQEEAAPEPEVVAVDAPPAEEPVAMEADVVEAEQPFWEAAAETEPEASDERPQSEPFWTPGTEELLRTALKTDQLVAELHGITGTMSDLDTDIDEPEPEHFAAPETGDEPDEAPTQDTGEWLIEEGERPATDLLNFDERPQTEPFWGNLDAELPALEPLDIDEPVTMDPFFEPVSDPEPFASLDQDQLPGDDAADLEAHAGALFPEPFEPIDGAPTSELTVEEVAPEAEAPAWQPAEPEQAVEWDALEAAEVEPEPEPVYEYAFDFTDSSSESTDAPEAESWTLEWQPATEPEMPDGFEALEMTAEIEQPVADAEAEAVDPAGRITPPLTGDVADILATAMLGTVEALAAREAERQQAADTEPAAEQAAPTEDVIPFDLDAAADEALDDPWPVANEDTAEAQADTAAEPVWFDEDAIEFESYFEPDAGEPAMVDAEAPGPEIEVDLAGADHGLLDSLDLEPFDASEALEPDAYDFSAEFPEVDDEELDRLVAEIEGDSLTTPDWLHQGEAPDFSAAQEEPVEDEPAPEPQTGELPDATGPLATTDTGVLDLGAISLERFLVGGDSTALSSALLDMAFSSPLPDPAAPAESASETISVFDESSERALEIEMFETFSLEAVDHLEALGRAAMQLDRDPHASEPLIDVKRALHTLKGAAAAAELDAISELAHRLEDSLANHERLGTLADGDVAGELFAAVEEIEALLARRKDELYGAGDDEADSPSLRVEISRVDTLLNTVGELVVNRSGLEERLERLGATLGDLSTAATRLQRSNVLLERESHAEDAIGRLLRGELTQGDAFTVDTPHGEWDALEMDRYTEFDRLIRQLAEVGADVSAAVGEIAALRGDLDSIATRQRRLTTALQDELMGIRMVPISSLAPRLYRVVRGAAGRRGKDVSFVLEGGETPFDKLLLDTLSESLLHLLRNAVDHGIEDPATRRRLGKPETGTVRVRAFRDGSEAVIEIIDDGAGVDHEAIARQAVERGLISDANISREAALALIFEPGFSTRGEADDISGRGIGLEIVGQTVARYKGRVTVDSVPGRGTVFSLRLPVQLSVIQAFLVSAGDGNFAIPVANVEYVVDRIDQPLTQIGDSIVVESGDQIIPVVDVGGRLGRASVPLMEREGGWVMVTEVAGKRWALVVDELHSQQEIVVKPMGRYLRSMPGLMGATILGHGDVALIVDVPTMLGVDTLGTRLSPITASAALPETPPVRPQTDLLSGAPSRVILIVDDSLSVRRVVSRTVERHGWVAVMARDGAEALEILDQAPVDIVITDIEMPRMDGFELITAIRTRPALSDLPVVVLTSRSGEKHRERAFSLGADEYLVKPFQEQELVGVVEDLAHAPAGAH